jgi:fatty acid desaturase
LSVQDLTPHQAPAGDSGAGSTGTRVRTAIEIPTLFLLLVAYGGWLSVTLAYARWPLAIVAPLVAVLITLHSSLQHEIVHGHPTRWPAVNRLLAIVPLSLWLPFERYRVLHRTHHIDERITDPLDDPESYYLTPERLARLGRIERWILEVQQTLAGRLFVGSYWRIGVFLHAEARAMLADINDVRAVWLEHFAWCTLVIVWVKFVCGIPLWIYVLTMVLPANALLLIRSFAEHRARPFARQRIAIVENSWILGPLFLFNNLHALHHEQPMVPWYRYHRHYRAARERLIAENGGLVYRTYLDVARRYLFRRHDVLAHPNGRVPPEAKRALSQAA